MIKESTYTAYSDVDGMDKLLYTKTKHFPFSTTSAAFRSKKGSSASSGRKTTKRNTINSHKVSKVNYTPSSFGRRSFVPNKPKVSVPLSPSKVYTN